MRKPYRNTPRRQRMEIVFYSTIFAVLGASIGYYIAMAEAAAKVAEYTAK